ncbi:MAG: hypothetical protein WCT31_00050 [Candidatus Micrarchaeia archaeon]
MESAYESRVRALPFSSISIDDCHSAYHDGEFSLAPAQRKMYEDIIAEYQGKFVAIRSDERTAHGVGAYSTRFRYIDRNRESIQDAVKTLIGILSNQFNPIATALRERVGFEEGIGIQIMPLAAHPLLVPYPDRTILLPQVSLAGTTMKGKGEIIYSVGWGIGGGVENASHSRYRNGGDLGGFEMPNGEEKICVVEIEGREGVYRHVSPMGLAHIDYVNIVESAQFWENLDLYDSLRYALGSMLETARDAGTDFYFELQLTDKKAKEWTITQIAEHTWPVIEKPAGKELYVINGTDVIGSAVVPFSRIIESRPGTLGFCDNHDELKTLAPQNPGALLSLRTSHVTKEAFQYFSKLAGIVQNGTHATAFGSHVAGLYRLAGIPVLGKLRAVGENNKNSENMVLWADEVNRVGGYSSSGLRFLYFWQKISIMPA